MTTEIFIVLDLELGWDSIIAVYPRDKFSLIEVQNAHPDCYIKHEIMSVRLMDAEDYQ